MNSCFIARLSQNRPFPISDSKRFPFLCMIDQFMYKLKPRCFCREKKSFTGRLQKNNYYSLEKNCPAYVPSFSLCDLEKSTCLVSVLPEVSALKISITEQKISTVINIRGNLKQSFEHKQFSKDHNF